MKSSIGNLLKKTALRSFGKGLAAALVSVASLNSLYAQQYVASTSKTVNTEALASSYVNNEDNAEGAPNGLSATISASGIVVNLGVSVTYTSDASLTMTFSPALPAGKTTYVRISELSQTGLNLDLSSLVNALGLLQNNTIKATSNGGVTQKELVRDAAGNLYIAVTPTSSYTAVTVGLDFANATSTLVGVALGRVTLKVEHAVSYENSVFTPCEAIPFAYAGVSPHASGIALTLTDALQDPEKAIDGDVSAGNFSLLQNGTVAVASTVSQTIYLGKTVAPTNQIVATISKPAALANLGVLENITIQAYSGETPVGGARTVESLLLDLDLLTLFGNDNIVKVAFVPGGVVNYDRIVVKSVTILNANLFTGLRIHELGSRPPVEFTGGTVATGRVGDAVSTNLFTAKTGGLPSFSIKCGLPTEYTYALYQVSAPGGRTLAGTLPSTVTLNSNGTFSGTPTTGQNGTYVFDVRATNKFGQTAVASFEMTIENALPVTLVSFKAISEGETASLSWATSEETNSDRFDIERSLNGKNWVKIGSVASNQESVVTRFYSFVDAAPLRGNNLYRLKMVDLDETFSYSRIESLNFKATALVYPNPVNSSETLTFNVGDWSKVSNVKVVAASGKVVFEASNAIASGISAHSLVAGAYIVQVTNVDGTISTQRFVRL